MPPTLPTYKGVATTVQTTIPRLPAPPIPVGRPSFNLGSPINSVVNSIPNLPAHITPSNPVPYQIFRPQPARLPGTNPTATAARNAKNAGVTVGSPNLGSLISAAVKATTGAVTRPLGTSNTPRSTPTLPESARVALNRILGR